MTTLAFSRGWSRSAVASHPVIFAATLMARRVYRRLKIRNDRRRLQGLPDYLLKDIGISRSQIEPATEQGELFRARHWR